MHMYESPTITQEMTQGAFQLLTQTDSGLQCRTLCKNIRVLSIRLHEGKLCYTIKLYNTRCHISNGTVSLSQMSLGSVAATTLLN